MTPLPRIGFAYLGGRHHLLHSAPVAAALARSGEAKVTAFVPDEGDAEEFRRIVGEAGAPDVPVRTMPPPPLGGVLGRIEPGWGAAKLPRLLAAAPALRRQDALVLTDRTATALRRLPGRCPFLIHVPHGTGDRARGFEARLSLFDLVVVPGEKNRRRMIEERGLDPAACVASGYVKLGHLRAHPRERAPLFPDGRTAVLYNPHDDARLSSLGVAREVVARFAEQDRYGLVLAPHVKAFARASAEERAAFEGLAVPGRVIVDLGSPRCLDMTYTNGADVYLGDVSSQAYEFAATPRPAVFLNAHGARWRGDPDYRHWEMGLVVPSPDEIVPALDARASWSPPFEAVQRERAGAAFGDHEHAAENAARIILDALRRAGAAGLD